jgi:hypothetical protein
MAGYPHNGHTDIVGRASLVKADGSVKQVVSDELRGWIFFFQ